MENKLNFDGGLTCSVGVKDLDKAIEWYQEKLGFELIYKLDEMNWSEMKTFVDKVNLGLSKVDEIPTELGITLTFGVKDIDFARTEMEAKGVEFIGDIVVIDKMVKLTTFKDLDGNKFMLYQDAGE